MKPLLISVHFCGTRWPAHGNCCMSGLEWAEASEVPGGQNWRRCWRSVVDFALVQPWEWLLPSTLYPRFLACLTPEAALIWWYYEVFCRICLYAVKVDGDFVSFIGLHKQDLYVCMHTKGPVCQTSFPTMVAKMLRLCHTLMKGTALVKRAQLWVRSTWQQGLTSLFTTWVILTSKYYLAKL